MLLRCRGKRCGWIWRIGFSRLRCEATFRCWLVGRSVGRPSANRNEQPIREQVLPTTGPVDNGRQTQPPGPADQSVCFRADRPSVSRLARTLSKWESTDDAGKKRKFPLQHSGRVERIPSSGVIVDKSVNWLSVLDFW
ncbi:Protein SCO2 [Trichinella pseudospiralis]